MLTENTLDVRIIEPRLKHMTIFANFDNLEPGESMVIINDHDPAPLYYQLLAERPNQFTWQYLQNGPVEWQVKIEKPLNPSNEKTIGKIAAEDYRKAMVFKKFGLDFCCGGKKTLDQAAKEKGIPKEIVQRELDQLDEVKDDQDENFDQWNLTDLIDHIVQKHHEYVKTRLPEIKMVLHKVVNVHGEGHPELLDLYHNVSWMDGELNTHLQKEEGVLFPYIKELENKQGSYTPQTYAVKSAIPIMEEEHEAAAEYFINIRKITSDYQVPSGACGSYRMLYSLLNEFEEDLKQHVHLENNILFPKAIKLELDILNQ